MLSYIISYLSENLSLLQPIEKVLGLAEIIEEPVEGTSIIRFPAVRVNGEPVHIDFDTANTQLFFLLDGDIQRETTEDKFVACTYRIKETYKLKAILYTQGTEDINCSSFSQRLAWVISKTVTGKHKQLMAATGLDFVLIETSSTSLDKVAIWKEMYSTACQLKETDILAKINLRISVEGDEACFVPPVCTT